MKRSFILSAAFLIVQFFFFEKSYSQLLIGLEAAGNLSFTKEHVNETFVLKPNAYTGMYSSYDFSKYLKVSFSAGWSQKQLYYYSVTDTYSALHKITQQLSFMFPNIPPDQLEAIIRGMFNATNLQINDTVSEKNFGRIVFHYIDISPAYFITWKNISFEIGPSCSFLLNAKQYNTFIQDAPIFEAIPLSNFDTIQMVSQFLHVLFPALNKPQTSTSDVTSKIPAIDYGFHAGFRFTINEHIAFSLRYTHGFKNSLHEYLPPKTTHRNLRAGVLIYLEPFKDSSPMVQ